MNSRLRILIFLFLSLLWRAVLGFKGDAAGVVAFLARSWC